MNNGTLRTVKGDATSPQRIGNEIVVIPHVCNNIKAWGAGFVMALSKKEETPKKCYEQMFKDRTPMLGEVSFSSFLHTSTYMEYPPYMGSAILEWRDNGYSDPKIFVANMIAQDGVIGRSNYKIPLRYSALVKSMRTVADWIKDREERFSVKHVIHTPKFGSELAGGNFKFISELIREIWLEDGISVVIYEYAK